MQGLIQNFSTSGGGGGGGGVREGGEREGETLMLQGGAVYFEMCTHAAI